MKDWPEVKVITLDPERLKKAFEQFNATMRMEWQRKFGGIK